MEMVEWISLELVLCHAIIVWIVIEVVNFVLDISLLADINELSLPKTCNVEFPDPDDLLSFKLTICPDEVTNQRAHYHFH